MIRLHLDPASLNALLADALRRAKVNGRAEAALESNILWLHLRDVHGFSGRIRLEVLDLPSDTTVRMAYEIRPGGGGGWRGLLLPLVPANFLLNLADRLGLLDRFPGEIDAQARTLTVDLNRLPQDPKRPPLGQLIALRALTLRGQPEPALDLEFDLRSPTHGPDPD